MHHRIWASTSPVTRGQADDRKILNYRRISQSSSVTSTSRSASTCTARSTHNPKSGDLSCVISQLRDHLIYAQVLREDEIQALLDAKACIEMSTAQAWTALEICRGSEATCAHRARVLPCGALGTLLLHKGAHRGSVAVAELSIANALGRRNAGKGRCKKCCSYHCKFAVADTLNSNRRGC